MSDRFGGFDTMRFKTVFCSAAVMAASMAFAAHAGAGEAKGYAVTWFQPAMFTGDDDCPDGLNKSPDFKAVFTAEGKTAEEIKNLIDHPNSKEFADAVEKRGPHGEDVCADPAAAPDPGHKTLQGKTAIGFNLDGKTDSSGPPAPNTCAHAKFTAPDGTPGIDNQYYRALGCMVALRGKRGHDGFVYAYIMERMKAEGLRTYLVEIKGMDDPKDNKDVEVGIYLGSDSLVLDAKGEVRRDTTQRISKDPRWHNVVHGTMKDGMITTETFDMNMLGDPFWIQEFHFKNAKMRLQIAADGSLRGFVGGYHAWFPFYWQYGSEGWGVDATNNIDLPGFYYALKNAADADPDPKTGENRMISSTWLLEAVPAFVTHPDDRRAELTPTTEGAARGK
jgi:hypothetical protein